MPDPAGRQACLLADGSEVQTSGAAAMLDVILLLIGLGFFALSIAYAFGCEGL